jgi:poly-gamma-glutamate synthesis protein (capsule biosynthesis protein)
MLPGLRSSGIDAVSLANNHSLDYGRAALLRMIDSLRSAGIAFAGAGANLDSAARPIVARLRTCTLAVVCFSRLATGDQFAGTGRPGVATAYNPARLVAEIERARLSTGVVAVFLHWGRERSTMPMPVQRELARRCIDAGAVLVVGCHPHVLQGFEFYRGGLIAYSLGNFVFTNRDRRPTMILQTRFRGRELVSARIIPCRISDLRPEPVADVAALQAEFRRLSGLSVGARVDEAGFVGRE